MIVCVLAWFPEAFYDWEEEVPVEESSLTLSNVTNEKTEILLPVVNSFACCDIVLCVQRKQQQKSQQDNQSLFFRFRLILLL